MAIVFKSFGDRATEQFWMTGKPGRLLPPPLARLGLRKLWVVDNAAKLDDLRSPPGNRLEALKGARKGQFSIRINERYRVCFRWVDSDAYDVEVVDYHEG